MRMKIWEDITFLSKLHFFKANYWKITVYCTRPVIACKVSKRGGLEKCGQDMNKIF